VCSAGNYLEALLDNRAGQHSIRINGQFRVWFRWKDGRTEDVEIVDYQEETSMIDDTEKTAKLPPMHPGEMLGGVH